MASDPITSWQIYGEIMETERDLILVGSKITADVSAAMKLRHLLLERKVMTNLDSILKGRELLLPTKVRFIRFSQSCGLSSSHVWMLRVGL